MKIDPKSHYDQRYWEHRLTFIDHAGIPTQYTGPGLIWEGFDTIAKAVSFLVKGRTLLDIGCSAGDLASRFIPYGWEPYGVDISSYAIEHAVPTMKNRIALADISEAPEEIFGYGTSVALPRTYDLVMATDLLEHIYEEDLDKVFDWIASKTNQWIFFCVATLDPKSPQDKGSEFVLHKGESVPVGYEATAVSGHVNVRHWTYWAELFERKGLQIDWMRMYLFQMQREQDDGWRGTPGWNMTTTWILRKLDQ